mmetsp:Transcript_28240/g.74079  ORF Transcript_28240/g.74079 Transcript_28240/m.74079 type:complete len:85 (-) Transcript_28240:273-527(-)|eukprot:CAMPEP_0182915290 /NCGR_PEP_ID=MMETSP0105_2-20130417/228_1 /TAXON_ID=81532 ORGANISM="Acanthoeca-like sp., Strain 10tr" /NCGR_SAMPLE_ID=MMETSP0105_2 /ASSEMBLY_ACC=CAM_ASM_000205 /LENGTH=84 /DNA_ID=CAMNT_0025052135 /DNA_START=178 /DNA_END=432 /DNA_ORIENTATION=-
MGLIDWVRNYPTHMDFKGQEKSEWLFQLIILGFSIVGFLWGYACQQFYQTVCVLGAGVITASLLCLPAWPFYQMHPVQWLKKED